MQKINIVLLIFSNWVFLSIYMKKWFIFNKTYFEHIKLSYVYH